MLRIPGVHITLLDDVNSIHNITGQVKKFTVDVPLYVVPPSECEGSTWEQAMNPFFNFAVRSRRFMPFNCV